MIARYWDEHLTLSEWGNETMWQIARERLAKDETLDAVCVHEHAGWRLTFNRDGIIVGTANDMAKFCNAAMEWAGRFSGSRLVGYCRREKMIDHKFDCYYPCVAADAA